MISKYYLKFKVKWTKRRKKLFLKWVLEQLISCRATGDMDTALGNILVCVLLVFAYYDNNNFNFDWEFVTAGDDFFVILESWNAHLFDNLGTWVKNYGFTLENEKPVRNLWELNFCQTRCLIMNNEPTMVRLFPKSYIKDLCILQPWTSKEKWLKHMKGIGLAGLALAAGVPIMQTLYEKFVAIGDSEGVVTPFIPRWTEFSSLYALGRDLESKAKPISPANRVEFELAFGVPASMQKQLEAQIEGLDFQWDLEEGTGLSGFDFLQRELFDISTPINEHGPIGRHNAQG